MNVPRNTLLLLLTIVAVLVVVEDSVAQTQAWKFDEYGEVCTGDEKARLDNFAIELQMNPEYQGYILFYGGRCWLPCSEAYFRRRPRYPRKGEAEQRAGRLKPFLVEYRDVDPNRLVVINGGNRESWVAELWIVPKGAAPPVPRPTVPSRDIKYGKGKPGKREYCRPAKTQHH